MKIRLATLNDLPDLQEIYADARTFMVKSGNPGQWAPNHPSEALIRSDILTGSLYIATIDRRPVAAIALIFDVDPTYVHIDGQWLNEAPYAAIHRVAVATRVSGQGIARKLLAACEEIACNRHVWNLRIDTHIDNIPMQKAIIAAAFSYCGVITTHNGSLRLAYQKNLSCQEASSCIP